MKTILQGLSALFQYVGPTIGGVLCIGFVYSQMGMLGAFIAVVLVPVAVPLIPLWAGFGEQYWLPALFVYGGMAIGSALMLLAERLPD